MKNIISTLIDSSILAAGLLSISALDASALTLQGNSCDISQLTSSIDCKGTFNGNDANQDLSGLFEVNDWAEFLKVDSNSGTDGNLTVNAGGTWSISGLDSSSNYMVVLKGGNSFSSYFLGSGLTSANGTWNTQGVVKGNGKPGPGLSHFTVYEGSGPAAGAPEPTTIGGFLLAGAILNKLRRMKSKKNS